MNFDDAVAAGAMALFGEKYGDEVRVLRIGEFSTELCGGTHVSRAGDIGLFKILSEGGVAAGVRRIEAVTGEGAFDYVLETEHRLRDVAGLVRGSRDDVEDKVRQLIERGRKLEKEIAQLKDKLASGRGQDLAAEAVEIGGLKVVAHERRRRRRRGAAQRRGPAQEPARLRGDRARRGGRGRQGDAGRRRHRRCHREVKAGESSTSWRSRSAARAAAGPTWRRPAAPTPRPCRRRCSRWRAGCGSASARDSGPVGPRRATDCSRIGCFHSDSD